MPGFGLSSVSRRSVVAGLGISALPGSGRATEQPRYGGVFVVGTAVEPRHLNLNITPDFSVKLIASPLYNKLVIMQRDFTFRPDLARSWAVSPDGRFYTFKLEPNVLWHDGEAFTSADVKFTVESILFAYHPVGRTVASTVESVTTPDPLTVAFSLNMPDDAFLAFLSAEGYIQPKHLYENRDILIAPGNTQPVGTGPFRFAHWIRGQEVGLERNDTYFRKDQPYVGRIVTRFLPDDIARVTALRSGEVDYLPSRDLPIEAIPELRRDKALTVTSAGHEARGAVAELALDLDKPPYNDVRVRRALSYGIDRQAIADKATFGLMRPATSPLSSDIIWAYNPSLSLYRYDQAQANRLLDEAGLARGANGIRFNASLAVRGVSQPALTSAQLIAEQVAALGVQIEIHAMDAVALDEWVYVRRGFDMAILSPPNGPDPAFGFQRQFSSTNIQPTRNSNASGYRNSEVDGLFLQAATSSSRADRAGLYKQIQAILANDASVVWLYQDTPCSAFRSGFGNLHTSAAESVHNYDDVYWKDGSATRT